MSSSRRLVILSGGTGLVGSRLTSLLSETGAQIVNLSRSATSPHSLPWRPELGKLIKSDGLAKAFESASCVVHLAGENVASWFWTKKQKQKILQSRILGTEAVVELMRRHSPPSTPLLSASAIGFYPSHSEVPISEDNAPGTGFLADVVKRWEATAQQAATHNRRVICARISVVLAREGGLLKKLLPIFRLGLGGRLGDGKHMMSWIGIDDLCQALLFLSEHSSAQGVFNLCSPYPVSNSDFTQTLARVLSRPAFLPVPRLALRMLFGAEMCNEMFFANQQILPTRLIDADFSFQHPQLEDALRSILNTL